MKKLAIMVASLMLAATSFGYLSVFWDAAGFLDKDGGIATENAEKIIWQLVYTTQTSVTPTYTYDNGVISSTSEQEVLSTRTWTGGDTMSVSDGASSKTPLQLATDSEYGVYIDDDDYAYHNESYTPSSKAGGVYSAIFRYGDDGSIYYAVSGLVFGEDVNWTSSDLPDTVVLFDASNPTKIDTLLYKPDEPGPGPQPTVPEPATMSLLGLGALGMVLRRKLRK